MIGQTISHYTILEKLGEGGMGVVYKAHDTKLDRYVALKFLPQQITVSEEDKARFLQEAKAISALNHTNIATIFDIDDADGKKFLVLEYISGGTMKSQLNRRKTADQELSISEVIGYSIQMAEGLAHAHRHGIVHRDIKSDNVMLTDEGKVKITDFGLAKLRGTTQLTRTGSTIGTLAYMAPEQLRGEEIDHRADLFSFGVVMYEMAALRLPFRGEHEAALTYSIANEDPASVSSHRKDIPQELDQIIMKCLQKDRASRYQSAAEIAEDLRALQQKATNPAKQGARMRRGRLHWTVAAAIIVLGTIGIFLFMPASHPTGANSKTIAVLPFNNLTEQKEDEYFSDGITEDILTQLSKIADLSVISRTSVMQYKGTKKNIHEIGKELNAGMILEGSVRRAGDQVRIVAQLIDVSSDKHLWADTYDREYKQVFVIQSEIAQRIASSLQAKLSTAEKERLANPVTTDIEAYNDYLQGRYFVGLRTEEDYEKAVGCFQRAMKIDPNYARAWAGLAMAHSGQADNGFVPVENGYAKARKEIQKALGLDPNLAEAHAIIGSMKMNYDWDWPGAEASLRRALDLEPGNTTAMRYETVLFSFLGRFDEALALSHRAIALDPISTRVYVRLCNIAYFAGQLEEAEGAIRKALELSPQYQQAHETLGEIYLAQSKPEKALAEMQRETERPVQLCGLALVYHAMRKNNEADSALAELVKGYQDVDAYQIAEVFSYRREPDKAFDWLERAYKQRDAGLAFMKVDPLLHNIRKDTRYEELMKKMKLPL
jgi:serine/threonine protein kinase/Tfp pilus assembly protein PilF